MNKDPSLHIYVCTYLAFCTEISRWEKDRRLFNNPFFVFHIPCPMFP